MHIWRAHYRDGTRQPQETPWGKTNYKDLRHGDIREFEIFDTDRQRTVYTMYIPVDMKLVWRLRRTKSLTGHETSAHFIMAWNEKEKRICVVFEDGTNMIADDFNGTVLHLRPLSSYYDFEKIEGKVCQ